MSLENDSPTQQMAQGTDDEQATEESIHQPKINRAPSLGEGEADFWETLQRPAQMISITNPDRERAADRTNCTWRGDWKAASRLVASLTGCVGLNT